MGKTYNTLIPLITVVAALLFGTGIQPSQAASQLPAPASPKISLSEDGYTSKFISFTKPKNFSPKNSDQVSIQASADGRKWGVVQKAPWWQSVIEVTRFASKFKFLRLSYLRPGTSGAFTKPINLSSALRLRDNPYLVDDLRGSFTSSTNSLNVLWGSSPGEPAFEADWALPSLAVVTLLYGKTQKTVQVSASNGKYSFDIPKTDKSPIFRIQANFVFENGTIGKLYATVNRAQTKPPPEEVISSRSGFIQIDTSAYDSCVKTAGLYAVDGFDISGVNLYPTTFVIEKEGWVREYEDTVDLSEFREDGVFTIRAKMVTNDGTFIAISRTTKFDGYCEDFVEMPFSLEIPSTFDSTSKKGIPLKILSRVPADGYKCAVQVGEQEFSLELDSFGIGSMQFLGREAISNGQAGNLTGYCENQKNVGNLNALYFTMKSNSKTIWEIRTTSGR